MNHLNSAVVMAAQSNPGHEFVMSPAGQGFTGAVVVGAIITIVVLLMKGRRGKSGS